MLYLQSIKTGKYIYMTVTGFYAWVNDKQVATGFKDRQEINERTQHIYNQVVNGIDIVEADI